MLEYYWMGMDINIFVKLELLLNQFLLGIEVSKNRKINSLDKVYYCYVGFLIDLNHSVIYQS